MFLALVMSFLRKTLKHLGLFNVIIHLQAINEIIRPERIAAVVLPVI
jgi:hypothetical protein